MRQFSPSRRLRAPGGPSHSRGDDGAILLLSLVFLLAVSLVVGSMLGWLRNDLSNTAAFSTASKTEYAVGAATQVEIQELRYGYTAPTSTPYNCTPGPGSSITINQQAISVYCTIVFNPQSPSTRVATLSACLASVAQATCVSSPFLQATVSFDDFSFAGTFGCSSASNQTTCGTGMTLTSWIIN